MLFRRRKSSPVPSPTSWRETPLFDGNTFTDDTDFYLPPLAGPSTIAAAATSPETIRAALDVLRRLTPDQYARFLTSFYEAGLARFGDGWRYADINTVLISIASMFPIRDYLEIGVRRGRSIAMIASSQPDVRVAGFDMWVADYAGMPNPGPDFVRDEVRRAGHRGELELITGDSHETVQRFFREQPDRWFDVITVDGDHSLEGARADIETSVARLRIGGILVFDDISSQYHPYLSDLWDEMTADVTRWAGWRFDDVGFGVAFAVRKQ